MLKEHVKPGVTTEDLDRLAYEHIVNVQKAIPANVGYNGFPKTLCTSVNHVICHGIPSPGKLLKDGDIINLDVTVIRDGWQRDTSRRYEVVQDVLQIQPPIRRPLNVAQKILFIKVRFGRSAPSSFSGVLRPHISSLLTSSIEEHRFES